ncbi:MAG: hypothetical protein M1570_12365 [Chloroflexi bacterium]|nr:hypothetical protein [Chloroflexota bacterium]
MDITKMSAKRKCLTWASSHQAAAVIMLLTLLVPRLALGADGLPKYAFSFPPGPGVVDALRNAEACGLKGKVLVMPEVRLNFSGADEAGGPLAEQAKIVSSAPEGSEFFLHIRFPGGALTGNEPEKAITDRVASFVKQLPLSPAAVRGLVVELEDPIAAPDLAAFALINFAVAAKGSKTDLRVAFAMPNGFELRHGDMVKRLAIYADLFGLPYGAGWTDDAAWIGSQALNKPLLLKLERLNTTPAAFLSASMAASGSTVETLWIEPQDGPGMSAVCAASNELGRLVTSQFITSSPDALPFRIRVNGAAPGAQKVFAAGASGDIAILARVNGTEASSGNVVLEGRSAGNFEIRWVDPLRGSQLSAGEVKKDAANVTQACDCKSEFALVQIHRTETDEGRVYTAVEVKGTADLSVEEIIARWQQYRESQRRKLETFMASCFMNLHFEGTNIGSGFDISMHFREFSNRGAPVEYLQTEFFVNGVKFSNKREFPLGQLEPDKVMTQPLELKLNEKYEYKLLGTETVNGVPSFVVGVEPKEQGENLYSGKIWIDGSTFRQVKQYLRQRGEKGNVISNIETQSFDLVSDGKGNQFNLVKSIYAQQLLNAAGRNFVLQKTYQFSDFAINATEFDAALKAAHDSDNPMFSDTDLGLRPLRKKDGQRVVEQTTSKRVKSIVAGMMYSGAYSFPIPLFGWSFVDFNFRSTGAQVSVFFAGPILAANTSKQYGRKFRLGVDVAVSGLPGNNRVYAGNQEVKTETLWQWQENAGLRATWQATTSLSLTASSYFSYEYFRGNSDTDKLFVAPRAGVSLLPSAEVKYARRGYVLTGQTTRGQRLGWTPFGYAAQAAPAKSAYTLYSGNLAKTYYVGKFTKAGWDFAYYGGNQLDRFSRYQPSFFSQPRVHGLPSGYNTFDAVAIGSVNYGFNIMDFIKFEGMYSYARGRNLDESRRFTKFDGLELNFGTAGPWGTYMQGTVSYALHGNIPRYNSRWGAYIMVFKPLR